jgi:N-acyl homoserine lactone hydrolase
MRIHALQTGTVAVRERQRRGEGRRWRLARTLADRRWTPPLPIYAWLIEHPEGLILVDTGETARAGEPGYFPAWHPYFRLGVREWVRPEQEIGPQLHTLGFSPDDVRWLVLTHLHTDHAGGLAHFARTEILVSKTELEYARGFAGRLRGYLPQHWPDWFAPELVRPGPVPFGPFPASAPLTEAGDVHLIATAGHTPGHMSVAVEVEDTVVFFAGDTSYTEQLMLDGVTDGVSPNPADAQLTLTRIQRLVAERPTIYLPSHDPDAAARLTAREEHIPATPPSGAPTR